MSDYHRVVEVTLDEQTVARRGPDIEQERKVAIYDLLEQNHFSPIERAAGPYHLTLSVADNRLLLDICTTEDNPIVVFGLALSPFRKVVKDYWDICEGYFQAIKVANPSRIEAFDMGRRAAHNEGSDLLRERLKDKVELDHETARRLFTLICVLHLR
ncbi:MAG: UPF0262 family protein [Alphaproteobacteria bacterium]|nr:UPF0262 family protein [Alphaproteobacteria bacterium]